MADLCKLCVAEEARLKQRGPVAAQDAMLDVVKGEYSTAEDVRHGRVEIQPKHEVPRPGRQAASSQRQYFRDFMSMRAVVSGHGR